MGEAAPCLMRSVSQPLFASGEFKEGDPLRALTTSVSFGRFMTEPLNWEKWSSFSHNRTLEDVKKHSRPGSVAEKKAFFEAHYKNFAPKKENKPPNSTQLTNIPGVEPEIASNEDDCSPNLIFSNISNDDENISQDIASDMDMDIISGPKKLEISSCIKLQSSQKATIPEIGPKKVEIGPKKVEIGPKKVAIDVKNKKKSALQSLHMSMNFPPIINKFKEKQAVTRVSVNGIKKNSQLVSRPENKRSKPILDHLVNGNRKNLETSIAASTKKQISTTTVFSSFSFRSEERAAKRKEFFQKLEEKIQLQPKPKLKNPCQEKTRSDNKKLRRSTTVETKAQSNIMQKVPPTTQPCSPKLGRKPITALVQDTFCQSSKPKNFIEINKKKLSSKSKK